MLLMVMIQFIIISGTHSFTAKYLDSNDNEIDDITNKTTALGNRIIVLNDDLSETIAAFNVVAANQVLSSSNNLVVGGYNLEQSNVTINEANFEDLIVVGSLTIDPVNIDVTDNSHISVTDVSKTYDGTATISSIPISLDENNSIIETGDLITISNWKL
jgi:hypothetical protein